MASFVPTAAMAAMQIGLDTVQRKASNADTRAAAQSELGLKSAQIRQEQAIDEQDRQERLRRALAVQRARFGAQGLSSTEGSAAATLGGLALAANRDSQQAESITSLRLDRLAEEQAWAGRKNLLQSAQAPYRSAFSLLSRGVSLLSD